MRGRFRSRGATASPSGDAAPRARLRAVPVAAVLALAAPGVAAADDGFLPAIPAPAEPAAALAAVAEVASAPAAAEIVQAAAAPAAVTAAAAPAPAAAVASAKPVAEPVSAAAAPAEQAPDAVRALQATAVAPEPAAQAAEREQYRPAEERYQPATAPTGARAPAPDQPRAATKGTGASDAAVAAGESPAPQFVWNWVWHCAPAVDPGTVKLPENLPENAILNWVWDSSCAPGSASPIPDQYQDEGPRYHQQNLFVSIRVNSPGDDGDVTQGNMLVGSAPGTDLTGSGSRASPAAPPLPALPALALPWPATGTLPLQAALAPLSITPMPLPAAQVLPGLDVAVPAAAAPAGWATSSGAAVAAADRRRAPGAQERAGPVAAAADAGWRSAGEPAPPAARAATAAAPPTAYRPPQVAPRRGKAARGAEDGSGRSPLEGLSVNVAGSAGGGAGGGSGILVSAVAALLAAFVFWPPVQGARVIAVAGGPRRRVDGGRLERPG